MGKVEITVNGVAYPCRETMGAMLRFKNETGRDVTEMDPKSVADLCTYLWCCVTSATKAEGGEFSMSLMDFADAVAAEDMAAWSKSLKEESKPDDGQKKS